ncbi:histone-lysine N-methyltransferase SETMAR [Elysia marginata]|uniref:Histone-lysine N-methyltransferase SETMAR n=1 Tax=Elysia marginata TaxID=1093978 RepID=A0AAV4EN19_9GAST|nr:histone-lysine N-methyltransferase SETMAR [Elysia marginata]
MATTIKKWSKLEGQFINAFLYCNPLDRLRDAIRRKKPGLLRRGFVLQDDDATPHSANLAQQWLQRSATVGKFFLILPKIQTPYPLTVTGSYLLSHQSFIHKHSPMRLSPPSPFFVPLNEQMI